MLPSGINRQVILVDYIKQSVKQLIEEHETRDPYRLAKYMGIEIDEYPFRKIKGFILDIVGRVTIVLNSNLPDWMKRVVLAHELGHRQLSSPNMGYFFLSVHTLMEPKTEYEANRFAVELLTWEETQELEETLDQFAARVGIPRDMLRYKVSL